MIEDLKKLLGVEASSENKKRIIILRLKTKMTHRGKPIYVLTCRGHKKATTNPSFITKGRGWVELGQIFSVFRIVDAEDDGRMAEWIKIQIKEGKLKL